MTASLGESRFEKSSTCPLQDGSYLVSTVSMHNQILVVLLCLACIDAHGLTLEYILLPNQQRCPYLF